MNIPMFNAALLCVYSSSVKFLHYGVINKYVKRKKLEMCQYDTDAPAQGHPHPHADILQKMKLKKGP